MNLEEIVPALLTACPHATDAWEQHLVFWAGDERGDYNDVSVFAHHIVNSCAQRDFSEFTAFFSVLEEMVTSSNERVKDLGCIGLIEDIQTIASDQPSIYAELQGWLQRESRAAWQQVEAAWSGVGSLADMIRRERGGV